MNKQCTILIADRNKHIREYLQRELNGMGHATRLAYDGREVMRLIENDPPDLLIMDLELPYVDGPAILQYLSMRKQYIPVIVHTLPSAEAAGEVLAYPVSFVEKAGTNIDDLKAAVTRNLHHRSAPRSNDNDNDSDSDSQTLKRL